MYDFILIKYSENVDDGSTDRWLYFDDSEGISPLNVQRFLIIKQPTMSRNLVLLLFILTLAEACIL